MELGVKRLREVVTTEQAFILEALAAMFLLYWWLGFEITVLGTLAVIAGKVFRLSWKTG